MEYIQKCPECGCLEIWDADCIACEGSQQQDDGVDCPECEGSGYQDGILACSQCGIEDDACAFEAPAPTPPTDTQGGDAP